MPLVKYTSEIVKSYVSNNKISSQEVTDLMCAVYQSLASLSPRSCATPVESGLRESSLNEASLDEASLDEASLDENSFREVVPAAPAIPATPAVPFVPVDQAVTQDTIFCLICGKASKAIKGHLTKTHRIDIPTYRANFGLPKDFPMVAPSYSETRRKLAVAAGSGEKLQAGRERKKKNVGG